MKILVDFLEEVLQSWDMRGYFYLPSCVIWRPYPVLSTHTFKTYTQVYVFWDVLKNKIYQLNNLIGTLVFFFWVVVQSLSHVWLFVIHGLQHQTSLSFTISQSLLILMSIESVILYNHLILCLLLLLLPSVFSSIMVFSIWCSLYQMAKVLELQLQYRSFQWIFRVDFLWDWLVWSCSSRDCTTIQKHQFFGVRPFLMVQLSHPYMTICKTTALTIQTFVDKVMSLLFKYAV